LLLDDYSSIHSSLFFTYFSALATSIAFPAVAMCQYCPYGRDYKDFNEFTEDLYWEVSQLSASPEAQKNFLQEPLRDCVKHFETEELTAVVLELSNKFSASKLLTL
jgi:hypothetical protein